MYKQDVVKFAVIYYMYETKATCFRTTSLDFHDYFLRNYTGRNYIALLWSQYYGCSNVQYMHGHINRRYKFWQLFN